MTNPLWLPDPPAPKEGRIGDLLIKRGIIDDATCQRALEIQSREGGRLGRILINEGLVSRRDVYRCLSEDTWGLAFVDLREHPPEHAAGEGIDKTAMVVDGWVPLHRDETSATVAVCESPLITRRIRIAERLGLDVDAVTFVGSTDWDVESAWLSVWGTEICTEASDRLADDRPELSARGGFARWQMLALITFAVATGAACAWRPAAGFVIFLGVANLGYGLAVGFKLVCAIEGRRRVWHDRETRWRAEIAGDHSWDHKARRDPAELPTYTILVPAYQEQEVIATIIANLGTLHWPASKLEVLLLMEADDLATIEAARAARPPEFVRFVLLPNVGPRTKPKACNVGLMLAKGDFIVIYDAEDRPDPDQLLLVENTFHHVGDGYVCLQARLNYFNAYDNILTRLFALEYSAWFDYMLPGLSAMDLPIPLGGTSNHFRTDVLRDLLGWDAWNVTEDADLGVRAERLGWRVGIVSSTTWEEACSAWKPWIRQRTRWIKGYLVTAQVHLRHPWTYVRESGIRGVFGMFALIVGTPAMFLLWPILLVVTLVALVVPDQMSNLLPDWMQRASAVNLVMGNLTMMGLSAAAVGRRKLWPLLGFALLVPGYFALHAIAAWRAAYQLVFDPFRWEKTPHGISPGHDDDEVAPQPLPEPRPAVTGATEPSRAADDELVAHR